MNISLSNGQWKLKGFWPYVPFLGESLETGNELLGVTDWIDATVPGGVHYDLYKAGLIEDPYYELNSLKCEWVENRWWMYKTSFTVDGSLRGKCLDLLFKGVDYKAHFFLNNVKLGEHEGMYEPVTFAVSDKIKFGLENELIVLFENVPGEMSQIGRTSMSKTQKSRFNYKWDFSTRMVNIGMWDDVMIKVSGSPNLSDTFIQSGLENDKGYIKVSSRISGNAGETCLAKVLVDCNGTLLETCQLNVEFQGDDYDYNGKFIIENPQLWYPNGAGGQPLYGIRIQLYRNGVLSDEENHHTGIKTMEYRRNQGSSEDSLPYTFVVNGKPIYIKGVNLVPFDMMYGNVSKEVYDRYIFLLKNANINLVRIWGGGIIEKEYFYNLCDQNGIMVWQEFIQSSSGVDNVPSTDPHFLELLKATANHAVKTKRNHVCHTVWSGGNELADENRVPITYGHPNIKMLKNIVEELDPGKLFLPSSASGPNEFLNIDEPGRNHDVHGNWNYEGIVKHYEIYNKSDSLFHSEFGVNGCSSIRSLEKILEPDNLKVSGVKENLVWRHHGEWWCTLERDREIFGEFDSLEQFVKASQFIQAEGLRYSLEANRRRKFENSGSVVWQFNEPWPNVSCTSLVEYSSVPKMAYYWLKNAFAPVHASLKYGKLFYRPGEEFMGEVYVNNSLESGKMGVLCEILDAGGNLIKKYEEPDLWPIPGNGAFRLYEIRESIPEQNFGLFFVRLSLLDDEHNIVERNLYVFSQKTEKIFSSLFDLKRASLHIKNEGLEYKVKNIGEEVCLFIHGVNNSESENIFIENNFSSLFPGEETTFVLKAPEEKMVGNVFQLCWHYLNQ